MLFNFVTKNDLRISLDLANAEIATLNTLVAISENKIKQMRERICVLEAENSKLRERVDDAKFAPTVGTDAPHVEVVREGSKACVYVNGAKLTHVRSVSSKNLPGELHEVKIVLNGSYSVREL